MSQFLAQRLQSLSEYVPGEQPQDRKYIKLNTNESPFPPSEGVMQAISREEVANLRLYCDPDCKALTKALADRYGVGTDQVFVSNGSDDILNFAFMGFGADGAMFPEVTYGFYEVYAGLHGVPYETRPMNEDFSLNPSDYRNTGKMVVLANPNAQTGIALPALISIRLWPSARISRPPGSSVSRRPSVRHSIFRSKEIRRFGSVFPK